MCWLFRDCGVQLKKPYFQNRISIMMTSSNGNIVRVTGLLCEESPVPGKFSAHRPVTQSFDVFFYLRLNTQLSKQWRRRWSEMPSRSLWRHCNDVIRRPGTISTIKQASSHDGVVVWKCLSHYWPFVREIHRGPMDSPHKAPVMRSLDVFYNVPRRSCYVTVMSNRTIPHSDIITWNIMF